MPILRLFATVRVAAGTGKAEIPGDSVDEVISNASAEFGLDFAELVPICRVWVNGQSATIDTAVGPSDEVALLPPVSGG
jgi:molybdopterin converting factor small subunit